MSFDILAPHYTWMEHVFAGPRLQRMRLAWLESLRGCENILIVGEGHGHFLAQCVGRYPEARITCVDASGGMLRHAKQRAERAGARPNRVAFVHASLPAWSPPPGHFDAIVTHFFLDCFPPDELAAVVAALARGAKPQARWLIGDFTLPARGWRRKRAQAMHAVMYAFFRPVTKISARRVTPPDEFLQRAGFRLLGRKSAEWGLLGSDLWARG